MKKTDITIISEIVNASDEDLSSVAIYTALKKRMRDDVPSYRTFKRRLAALVEEGKIVRTGKARAVKYRRSARTPAPVAVDEARLVIPISDEGNAVQEYVRRPVQGREPAGYEHEFLEDYIPNDTCYLPEHIRRDLSLIGEIRKPAPTGSTYLPETVNRLLVDLSWASSRLEGNTYSLIDTQNLVVDGVFAEGKDRAEADMILNHKHAIDMLLENADSLGYNMYTFLSLHKLLSDNLMGDPGDCGRLRNKIVEIGGSVYSPLGFPQQVEDYFRMFLDKAKDIEDPFEQSFFTMVHLPYLQPFTDVNKRTARLGANIPLIKNRLCPLSFIDVPERDYIEGNLGVYELNDTSLLKDVYVWAYERSCRRYNTINRLGSSRDPYRTKYKQLLYSVTGKIIKQKLEATDACIAGLARGRVVSNDTDRFIRMVNDELRSMDAVGLNRYGVSMEEFNGWKQRQREPGDRPGPQ
ncbi:MAG: Fic family protein [Gammaproteobacteria bacterium]|nr:Fic family protein [Gammaproteobacteria bacterium]